MLVLKCIVEEATGCMIVGLHLTDFHTKVAANLMDLGLRVAIFDISGITLKYDFLKFVFAVFDTSTIL